MICSQNLCSIDWCSDFFLQVLSLTEILWPCVLFLILAAIRFQEPPKYKENCMFCFACVLFWLPLIVEVFSKH